MFADLSGKRKNYLKFEIKDELLSNSPLDVFTQWFNNAEKYKGQEEINAMTLSTLGEDNTPYARIVLLKFFSIAGFDFFTNYHSLKGRQIAYNNSVCLSFFWEHMEQQVIIKGRATKLDEALSDKYFNERPYESRLAALASSQSDVLIAKNTLIKKWEKLKEEYPTQVPRPMNWGGYRVEPSYYEFWQGGAHRLHDRIRYQLEGGNWKIDRLSP